ncbi:MAG: periplasmic heavy metal sensor [Rhodospirillaceae bacterium]|nr:periplasmic heavy metal sensor [Rhodospirillaceae bacterium]
MSSRLTQVLLGLSLLLNLFVLTGFVYRSWIAPSMMGDHRPPGPPGQGNRPSPLEILAQELKLDDGQRAALREVFEKYGNTRRERQREIQKLREQMAAELQKPDTDLTKLEPLVDQLTRLRGEQQKENLRAMIELEPKLRPDQRERFEAMLAERLGGWWGRPGGPRGPGGPGRPPQ